MRLAARIVVAVALAGCGEPRRGGVGPVAVERYAFGPAEAAHSGGAPIDVAAENRAVSVYLRGLTAEVRRARPVLIVPGYSPLDDKEARELHPRGRQRLELAVEAFREVEALAILVSGGNVHPPDTPFNEALGMKRHLVEVLGVPAARVAIDPFARHSTTNLRNAGRFLLAHGVAEALVVTTPPQNFYFGMSRMSGFDERCRDELGYVVGELLFRIPTRTTFRPAREVLRRGDDPLDP